MKEGLTAFCAVGENRDQRSFQDMKDRFTLTNQDLIIYLQLREYYDYKVKREALG